MSASSRTGYGRGAAILSVGIGATGITVQQFNERAGGQVVFHLHFHVLTRFEGVSLAPPASKMEKPEALAASAEKIKKALSA